MIPVPAASRHAALRLLALAGLAVALLVAGLWFSGGLQWLELWAADRQREAQALMAGALRRLRAGEPGATAGLLGVCFAYGFLHAIGPGHGKLLIGGYGFGTQVPLRRLALLAVASSLAQAGTAVLLVGGGIALLNLSREALTDLGEEAMADLGAVLIGLVGLWLAWRGLRQLLRVAATAAPVTIGHAHGHPQHHDHDHHHHHGSNGHGGGCDCGHAHGPTPDQVIATTSWRDAVILIAGIAARPCTGALFLLILTWRMQIFGTGIAGAMAMGLGTASVAVVVAVLAVWARQGSLALWPRSGPLAALGGWLPGIMQLAAGAVIALMAAGMVI